MRLIKPEGQKYWHVEITTESGGKRLVNTQCLTKEAAQAVVEDSKIKELELASKAHRLTAEVVTLITANRQVLVKDAIEEWAEWLKVAARSDKTRDNNIQIAEQWVRDMSLSERSIGSISTDDIHQWINRQGSELKRATRLLYLSGIRNLFRYCLIKRYVLSDPSQLVAVDLRLMDHEQREVKHKQIFEDDEIEFLLAKCDNAEPPGITSGFFKAAIIMGRDLGLRLGDICNLEWSSFNFQKRTLSVWMGKTNTRIELPLTGRVTRLVSKLPAENKKYLFPNERGIINDVDRRAVLSTAFKRFFARHGYDGYSFHSLRATLSTTMAARGATLEEIAKALGHKSTMPTKAYVKVPSAAALNKR